MKCVLIFCVGLLFGIGNIINGSPIKSMREYPVHITKEATDTMSTLSLPSNATSIRADITDNFSCDGKPYGYYADVENECQIFHVCLPVEYPDGKARNFRWSFICPDETVFSQEMFTCVRSDDLSIDCNESERFYELNKNFGGFMEPEGESTDDNNDMSPSNEEENKIEVPKQTLSRPAPYPTSSRYTVQNTYEKQPTITEDDKQLSIKVNELAEYNTDPEMMNNPDNDDIYNKRIEQLNEDNYETNEPIVKMPEFIVPEEMKQEDSQPLNIIPLKINEPAMAQKNPETSIKNTNVAEKNSSEQIAVVEQISLPNEKKLEENVTEEGSVADKKIARRHIRRKNQKRRFLFSADA